MTFHRRIEPTASSPYHGTFIAASKTLVAERFAVGVLCVAAVLGPLLCGGTGAGARLGIEAAMAVAAILWSLSSARPLRLLVLPVAVASLILLQLMPLPDRLLMSLSPVSGGLWKAAHQDAPAAWGTVSINPAATAAGMRRLLLGLATVALVADMARTPQHRRWLAGTVAVSGTLVLALGLAFPVDVRERVILGFIDLKGPIKYWLTPIEPPIATAGVGELTPVTIGGLQYAAEEGNIGDGFGPFVYSNHFAGAMCLTLPFIIAAWLLLTAGRLHSAARYAVAFAIGAGGLWGTGALALSRGGAASLLLACLLFFALVAQGRWLRRLAVTAAAAYTAALVGVVCVFLGPLRGLETWLPTAVQPIAAKLLSDPRVSYSKAAMRIFRSSPWLGTGLDTFGDVHARLVPGRFVTYFAHNEYLQLLAETGLLGGGVALFFGGVLVIFFLRFCRSIARHMNLLDAGAWSALTGIATHAMFDWTLHSPANALFASIVSGLCIASVNTRVANGSLSAPPRTGLPVRLATVVFATACLAALVFLTRDAVSETVQRKLRTALTADRIAMNTPGAPRRKTSLATAITAGERLARWDPSNARLAVLLGHAHLHLAATETDNAPDNRSSGDADAWFASAMRCSAACRGLPEDATRVRP